MTRNRILACAFVFAVLSLDAHAAVQLRLRVEPASQLPGIEPSLRVEAVNTGSAPAQLPLSVALQVTPPGERKPFVAYTGMRGDDRVTWFYTDDDKPIVLAPGETRDLSFWAGPQMPVWFASDSRLLSSGTYRFQLVADDKLSSELLDQVERATDQAGLSDPVVSNEASYIVETPRGEDAAVWELIKQLSSPMSWPDALGRRIWAEYPGSRYAAYCLNDPKSTDPAISIPAFTAALEKQPSRSWADWYHLGIAHDEISRSENFITARDVDGAFAAIQRAERLLTRLVKDGADPQLRKEARQLLDTHVLTREDLVDYIKRLNREIRETRPFAVCIENLNDGKHVFWFGYENTTLEPMKIPVGADNKFTPPPFDRGQPTTFPPYREVLGVRIVTDEPAVTWHLQNRNVQASVEKTQPCPADLHERYTYEPPQRD